jgi:hypothetical protein
MLFIFGLLIAFQFKHFLADYPLQTPYMLQKFKPGWEFVKPLAAHAGTHAAFTWLICLVFAVIKGKVPVYLPPAMALLDFTVHFVVDRIKASPRLLGRYKALSAKEFPDTIRDASGGYKIGGDTYMVPEGKARDARKALLDNKYFWWALGWDQMMHHLTHYLIIYLLFR